MAVSDGAPASLHESLSEDRDQQRGRGRAQLPNATTRWPVSFFIHPVGGCRQGATAQGYSEFALRISFVQTIIFGEAEGKFHLQGYYFLVGCMFVLFSVWVGLYFHLKCSSHRAEARETS